MTINLGRTQRHAGRAGAVERAAKALTKRAQKTRRQLEEENARMREALETIGADLGTVRDDDMAVWRFVGGTEVVVCQGLDIPIYVDGKPRFTIPRTTQVPPAEEQEKKGQGA